jgi:hypothetical protein
MYQDSIVIGSEEKAWSVLEDFLKKQNFDKYVEFNNWPIINLNIKGDRYPSTLPANLVDRLSYIQGNLNTFYGKFVYGGDARNLKKFEKHEIELIYNIQKGSTDIKADATGLLNKLGESMSKPGTQKITGITLCVIALTIAGAVVFTNNSDNIRDIEIQRLKLLEKAIETSPNLKGSSLELHNTFKRIISSASDANNITIGRTVFDRDAINSIAERTRNKVEHVKIEGQYKINSIRGYERYYLVEVIFDKTTNIRARLLKNNILQEHLKLLTNSLTGDTLVPLTFTAKKINDGYASAVIESINT